MNKNFQPAVSTGGYGDGHFEDEWLWAASELLTTTGDSVYLPTVKQRLNDPLAVPGWPNVGMLGYYTLLRKRAAGIDLMPVQRKLIQFADALIANGGDKAYATIMGQSPRDFVWGSSSVALNQGIVLINAYLLSRDKKYLTHAISNLDYIMGRNATGYCLVTGIGYKSTLHPHHRPSVADGIEAPVPGLLAGGPNPGRQDRCTGYPSSMPAEAYLDHDCSYASNEIAINWNAPLVYVANALEALLGRE